MRYASLTLKEDAYGTTAQASLATSCTSCDVQEETTRVVIVIMVIMDDHQHQEKPDVL